MEIGQRKLDDCEIVAHDCEIVAHNREIGENPVIAIRHVDASDSLRQDQTAEI